MNRRSEGQGGAQDRRSVEPANAPEDELVVGESAPETDALSAIETTAVEPAIVGVGQRAASGVFWLTAQKWAIRLFGFVTIAILTRLLSPADFGTVAAASTMLPFFYLLADLGFAAYIVQVEKTDRRMLSTAFWFSMSAGIVLCGALFALSPLLGLAFSDPRVVPVLQALSVWVIITAIGSVPMAILRREMRFATIAAQGAGAAVVAQVVALILAFTGAGVWALVAQSLIAPLVSTAFAWIVVRWRPSFTFSRHDLRHMATFGGQVLGVEFVAMLRAWGEAAVTSATLGIAALGYMSIAQRLVQIVQDLTGSAIVPVTNVAFAKIREESERLRAAYLRALRLTYAALSLPLTFVAVGAPLIVPILFGNGWSHSIPVAQILALAGMLSIGAWLDHGLFYGIGRPGAWFVYALITDAITFLTTLVVAHWGLSAIAWGFLGVTIVATVARWFLVARYVGARTLTVAAPFAYLVTVVVVSGAAGVGVQLLTTHLPGIVSLLLIGLTIFVVHVACTMLISRSILRDAAGVLGRTGIGSRLPFMSRWGNS